MTRVLLLLGLISGPAWALPSGSAAAHAYKANRLVSSMSYSEAAEEYQQAYLASSEPAFLYGRAECFYFLWACEGTLGYRNEARDLLRRYLSEAPAGAPEREQTATYLRRLEADDRPRDPSCRSPDAATPTGEATPSARSARRSPTTVVAASVAGGLLLGAGATWLWAESKYKAAPGECGTEFDCSGTADAVDRIDVVSGVLLIGGLVAGGIAVWSKVSEPGDVSVAISSRSAIVGRTWTW